MILRRAMDVNIGTENCAFPKLNIKLSLHIFHDKNPPISGPIKL